MVKRSKEFIPGRFLLENLFTPRLTTLLSEELGRRAETLRRILAESTLLEISGGSSDYNK
jgi:hypothetical protein